MVVCVCVWLSYLCGCGWTTRSSECWPCWPHIVTRDFPLNKSNVTKLHCSLAWLQKKRVLVVQNKKKATTQPRHRSKQQKLKNTNIYTRMGAKQLIYHSFVTRWYTKSETFRNTKNLTHYTVAYFPQSAHQRSGKTFQECEKHLLEILIMVLYSILQIKMSIYVRLAVMVLSPAFEHR